jgi:hypothetical protein
MQSDNKHMDEFFRNKLQEADADLSAADQHWDAMKTSLVQPVPVQPKPKPVSLLLKAAAIVILITGISFLIISRSSSSGSPDDLAKTVNTKKYKVNEPTDTVKTQHSFYGSMVFNLNDYLKNSSFGPFKLFNDGDPFYTNQNVTTATLDSSSIIEEQKSNAIVFSNFFQQLKKRPEEFHIDTQRDTTIRCSEGSVIRIPANSFQTATGLAISGIVNMQVQEFYSLADIIGNKLSTTSNGQMLETGGMLCIKALFQSEEVKIKPGSALDLSMPAPKFNPEMQLFMGENSLPAKEKSSIESNSSRASENASSRPMDTFSRNSANSVSYNFANSSIYSSGEGINWLPLGQQQMFYNNNKKIVTVLNMRNNPKSIYTTHPGNPDKSKTIGKFKIPFHAPQTKEEIRKTLLKKYSKYYDDIKVIRASKPLSKKRQSAKRSPWEWYETPYVADSVKIPISIATRLKYITVEDSLQFEKQWKEELELAMKRRGSYRDLLQISDKYNFKIENLGWINCDKFLGYPPGRTAEFTMVPEINFEKEYVYSMIVFKNTNAALACSWDYGAIKTQRIPLGEQVTLVSIGVKEGKAFTCVKDITITREKQSLEYTESSPEHFKEQLARLGRVTGRG